MILRNVTLFVSRRALLPVLALLALTLTGCLSHWFTDSTTRLQVENRSKSTILGIDIISEDGTSVRPWIKDTIEPGERSRVYEEDWVGTFNLRIKARHPLGASAQNGLRAYADGEYVIEDLEFDGGSEFLVVSDSEKGPGLHLEFK